jgi:hypothetical protein
MSALHHSLARVTSERGLALPQLVCQLCRTALLKLFGIKLPGLETIHFRKITPTQKTPAADQATVDNSGKRARPRKSKPA